ncbi:MAG: hypothetical protein ACRDSS_03430, partial [Actinocrinis sp.]
GQRHTVVALSHRPTPGASGRPLAERGGEFLIARSPDWFTSRARPLRLALHPDDLHRPGLRETTLRAIERALKLGARAVTYRELLALPDSARPLRSQAPSPSARPTAATR